VFRILYFFRLYLCKNFPVDLINLLAQAYAEKYTSPEDSLLATINQQTMASHPQAHMLSGHVQGKVLEFISSLVRPRRVLEIGTFTGYSAICLAKGLTTEGVLHTIEVRQEEAAVALQNFNLFGGIDKIILHTGNALEIVPLLNEQWDLVFIDADKVNYTNYYKMVLPQVRSGGIIIADNVFFHGEVLQESIKGKNAKAIQEFNDYVQQDQTVERLMLTIRDGLLVIVKK
jgi:caffeoyl-CoA O-methyltransferase